MLTDWLELPILVVLDVKT